jgi:predicted metal-dependent hydrolase
VPRTLVSHVDAFPGVSAAIIGPMAEPKTKRAPTRAKRPRMSAASASPAVASPEAPEAEPRLARGRTLPLDPKEQHELLHRGVALFNGLRYWHAHEVWETLWRAAEDEDRDFYQGLIMVAAGLLHLQRRNARGARNKLDEGLAKLKNYEPAHRGLVVTELVAKCTLILNDLKEGLVPYLIPPVIRFVDVERATDFNR